MQCQRRCFAIPATSLNPDGWSGEQQGPRRGCAGAWVRSAPAVRGWGCPGGAARARDFAQIFAIAVGGAQAPLVAVADVWACPRVRAVSPGSLLLRWVGFGCAGARVRPGLSCGGGAVTRIFAIAVSGILSGLRGCAGPPRPRLWRWVSPGSLLLRLVGFGWG